MFQISRRHVIVGALLLGAVIFAVIAMQPQAAAGSIATPPDTSNDSAPQQGIITTSAQYFWSYSVKFVCGFQGPPAPGAVGEPPVKPGNYATEINIHNYNYRDVPVFKKLLLLVGTPAASTSGEFILREPQVARPLKFLGIKLGPDNATMDDCDAVWAMADQTGMTLLPGTLTIGYLVIVSPIDLDIDAVYSAEVPGAPQTTPTSIALDVNRVAGKRVYVLANTLP